MHPIDPLILAATPAARAWQTALEVVETQRGLAMLEAEQADRRVLEVRRDTPLTTPAQVEVLARRVRVAADARATYDTLDRTLNALLDAMRNAGYDAIGTGWQDADVPGPHTCHEDDWAVVDIIQAERVGLVPVGWDPKGRLLDAMIRVQF